MKAILSLLLWLAPVLAFSQVADSSVVRQVDSLIQVSRTLTGKSDFGKALEINAAAEKLALEKLGRESAVYGNCCFNHGRVLHFKNDYRTAEKWYLESRAIREKVLGKEHLDYAASVNSLANLYNVMGQYEKAEPLYLESKAIREKAFGKDHPNYASSLNNLAVLYKTMGQYEKAESLYLESKTIREKSMGKEHPNYASCLNNLAVLYYAMGQYEKAEPLYLKSKAIWEKALGKEHPDYASSLNNLANLYYAMGQYEKAETLYLESKAIREKALGKEHPEYARSLNNLADLYKTMGQYEKAETLYLESKAIREKALGKEHPSYAASLNGLANLHYDMGQYKKAEPLYLESKAIREKALGKEHPEYARSLNNLANLYRDMGQYEKSEPLNLESIAIREKVLGKQHPGYAKSLKSIALLYWSMGQYEKAEPFFLELSTVNRHLIEKILCNLSERELNNYLNTFSERQGQTLSFTQISGRVKATLACYDNTLFYKGFLFNASSHINNLAQHDTAAIRLHNLLKSYHRRLAAEYAKPIAERKSVEELEAKANTAEKELVRTVAGYGEAIRQVNWQEVQSALKPGEAAIEFVHYNFYTPDPTDSVMYAALVLRPGDTQPAFIPLLEERQLTPLLRGIQGSDFDLIDQRYAFRNGKNALHALIWQPLDSLLQGVKTIYCSPSGLLHRINLGAVPLSSDQTFADRYHLVVLGSTRQLVTGRSTTANATAAATLFGGIQYDSKIMAAAQDPNSEEDMRGATATLPFPYDTTLRGGGDNSPWRPLPATETEVRNIAAMLQKRGFKTALQTGPAATEETFKQLGRTEPSPRILHLATHGYFFPDAKISKQSAVSSMQEPVFKLSDHPMIRAGLILAGANPTWTTGKPPEQGEDGILTAYEISQMNLSNTELVVLSACETGLGDLVGNEGVYGLQRAFRIAGAKYLVMSLWQVSDRMTGELMTEFYRQYLEEKKPVPDAFRGAQRAMRAKYPGSASAWAGFVLVE